ncbi:MAG: hypothetical protein NT075_33750 [Chloroflexi bacterium]|nr:hypothetical protein [Chloroflexota bacterium]
MKRICLIVSLMIVLFGSVLVLDTYRATRTVQAQAVPHAPAGPNTVYLPFIDRHVSRIKQKSGIHLGNRNSSDWREELFTLVTLHGDRHLAGGGHRAE